LIESLQYLPKRKQTYIDLCDFYKIDDDKKSYEKWFATMQKQFPEDVDLLLITAQTSLEKKTYTKALTLLKQALKIDSINSKAKLLLAYAYFEKMLFELGRNKLSNAISDLKQLEHVQGSLNPLCLLPVAQSILACYQDDLPSMNEQLNLAYQQAGTRLLVNYLVERCNTAFQLKIDRLRKKLVWDEADKSALVTLSQGIQGVLNYYKARDLKQFLAIDKNTFLKKQITAAIEQCNSYVDFEGLCALFIGIHWYNALTLTAEAALNAHKKSALFVYYKVEGETKGDPERINSKHHSALLNAYDKMTEKEKPKAAPLIDKLLDDAHSHRIPCYFDFPFPSRGRSQHYEEMVEDFFD
jgi:hypothetical protein